MSHYYFTGTAKLSFSGAPIITPVVFSMFMHYCDDLQGSNDGSVLLKVADGDECPSWDTIGEGIVECLGYTAGTAAEDAIMELASAYGGEAMRVAARIIENFESSLADVGMLFELAVACNDGHNLKALDLEGSWISVGGEHGGYAGRGEYRTEKVTVQVSSDLARRIGTNLEGAITGDRAPDAAFSCVGELLLGGIHDKSTRQAIRQQFASYLLSGTDDC